MRRLAEEGLQIGLAISLHAPNDELRSSLMPVNRRWPIAEVLAAAEYYVKQTGRRVSFEYTLMAGVNDSDALADDLAALLRGRLCHVNLIPLNPNEDLSLQASSSLARPGLRVAAALRRASRPRFGSIAAETSWPPAASCAWPKRSSAQRQRRHRREPPHLDQRSRRPS